MKLEVVKVEGRYPSRSRVFKPENIEVEVTQREGGVVVVHLDDKANHEFWLQLTLRLEAEAKA